MLFNHSAVCVSAAALLGVGCSASPPQRIVESDLVIEDVNVITMSGPAIEARRSVFVKDGVIVAIEPFSEASGPETATVVKGSGKFLIPGLSDMHVHVWAESELPLYVANGVTLVRNMWGEAPTLAMRKDIRSGRIAGPRIVTAGRLVDGHPPIWGDYSGVARTADEAIILMEEQREAGFDFFKVYSRLDEATFDGIAAHSRQIGFPFAGHVPDAVSLEHALQSGIAAIEHLIGWDAAASVSGSPYLTRRQEPDSAKRWSRNLEVAQRIAAGDLHLEQLFDLDETRRLAAVAAAENVYNVPTLVMNQRNVRSVMSRRQARAWFERPEARFLSPDLAKSWETRPDHWSNEFTDKQLESSLSLFDWALHVTQILDEAGAPLLVGTDAPNPFVMNGFAIHEELELLVEAGLTPYAALYAATRAPAEFLGQANKFGTIGNGMRADLVLLNENPLADISATRQIAGVVLNGTWYSKDRLDVQLEEVAKSYDPPDDWFEGIDPPDGEQLAV